MPVADCHPNDMMEPYRLLPFLALAGAAACAAPAPQAPAPRQAAFIEAEYEPYLRPGNGVVTGQVLLHTLAGEVRFGAGREVYLNPVTTYSTEWWTKAVIGGRELQDGDARARRYERLEIADRNGRFTFSDLPAGEYYLLSLVPGDVPVGDPGGSATHGERVGRRVLVSEGSRVEIGLDELERDSTGVADTLASGAADTTAGETDTTAAEIAEADSMPASQRVLASSHTEADGTDTTNGTDSPAPTKDSVPPAATPPARPYSAPPPPTASDEPMPERRLLTRFVPTRRALSDVLRLKIVSEYEEARPGLLVLALGEGYTSGTSVEYNLKRLFAAYEAFLQYEERAVLELWLNGQKIGEFTRDGLLVGPEFTTPR
jgi:hypothetical protein